jgi:hypothetical protein
MNMTRFTPYLGIVAALLLGAFIGTFSNGATIVHTPSTASSTLSTLPGLTLPPITLSNLDPKMAVATSSAQPATIPKKKVPPMKSPAPVPVSIPTSPSSSEVSAALDASASALRSALVNIICYVPAGSGMHSISGSGVIIDPKGTILTNAHVAQYFLLANRGVSCTIRAGSPAVDSYEAAFIFISPAWLRANASVLTQSNPSGTGEYDFALLAIVKSATTQSLPSSFPSTPLATIPPLSGTPIVIASYGAQFLETNQIQSFLFPTVVFGSVKDVLTFAVSTIDVLALGGSVAAQEGSSGGGVADASGKLMGTITTSTTQGATDTRSLDAITTSYIRGDYASETGEALDLLLAEPTATAIADFAPQIPALEAILTAQLP